MANYCTATEVRDIVSKVNVAAMDDTAVDNKIVYAQSIINSYLASRYTVPFTPVPTLVKTVCIDLAAYYIMRTLFTRDSVNKSDYIDDLLLNHINTEKQTGTLYDILNGLVPLVTSTGTVVSTNSDLVDSNIKDYYPIFDMDDETSQAIPSNRLDDIADGRDED